MTRFGENSNPGSFSATATSSVIARNDDGTLVRFTMTSHVIVVGADVIVGFDKLNYG
jgi:hypothetical protein